jgi:copper(I)-binding protein/cytochrome oxidase Cu insertion factor (SCO1/SenC/PrrC family)
MRIRNIMVVLLLWVSAPVFGDTPWNADYFPNVPLITHEGETVHFFDDLIKDKVVVINFIYTTCPDTCPLETARLARVQKILGDRVGKDIFMYSITIEPERDTPEVMAAYAKRYRAKPGWLFLTGKEEDITLLRQKLGLYLEEIQDDSNNHNLSLIIGNQATGRWMKRSPFENPYVLATQIGSWLSGWSMPSEEKLAYEEAPEVRNISQGEHLFRTRCVTCHTIGNGENVAAPELVGPDLLDVTKRREREWLSRWIARPDKMLEEGDPLALGLFAKYNEVPMPNMRMSRVDVEDVLDYISSESRRVRMDKARARRSQRRARMETPTTGVRHAVDVRRSEPAEPVGDAVAIMNAWVREAHLEAPTNAGYMTLINVGTEDVVLESLVSPAFEKVEMHDMTMADGMMRMRDLTELVIPAGGQARFEPSGKHLMLIGPYKPLTVGQTVELTLNFQSGQSQTIAVQVADR